MATEEPTHCKPDFVDESFSVNILRHLNRLRLQESLCDVVINCGNEKIMAHKIILAAASHYFSAMFTNGMSESALDEVELKELDHLSVKVLIDYAYSGVIKINNENVQSLLEASDLLQFKNARNCCCEYMINQIDASNCLGIYQIADRYSSESLSQAAVKFFNEHFTALTLTSQFMEINFFFLKKLIKADNINIQGEKDVLIACISWLEYDLERKKLHSSELLRLVRLPFIQPSELKGIICNYSFLSYLTKKDWLLIKSNSNKYQNNEVQMRDSYQQWLYILGGERSFLTEINDIECFNHQMKTWELRKPLKSALSSFAAVVIKDKLYVIGGMRKSVKLRSAKCFDPKTGKWTTLPPPLKCRGGIKAAVIENKLYVAGGSGERESACRYLERFDPEEEKRWVRLENMNKRRRRFNLVSLNGLLYALGGFDDSQGDLKSVENYDPATNNWTKIASMLTPRNDFGAVALSGYIYAVGGANGTQGSIDLVEKYDPDLNVWTKCARLANCRGGLSVAVFFGRIVALSGMNIYMSLVETAEYYNESEDKWSPFPPLQIARFGSVAICLPFELPHKGCSIVDVST